MEQEQKATVNIDGKDYIIENLSDGARYCIGQIQDLQQQAQAARARVDQLEMVNQGFMNALRAEIDIKELTAAVDGTAGMSVEAVSTFNLSSRLWIRVRLTSFFGLRDASSLESLAELTLGTVFR